MTQRDLTAEEIAELEKLRAVAARSLQDAATYRDAMYLQGDGLLAMATRLLELEDGHPQRNLLRAAQECLRVISDPDMHNAGKSEAVYRLEVTLSYSVYQIEQRRRVREKGGG